MKDSLKSARHTGNKTVQDPSGKNASQAKSDHGVDLKKGYDVISRPGALEKPDKVRK